jgi:hypothetical protein
MPDRRAVQILFNRYWRPTGWKPQSEVVTASDDFAYAKAKGLMFDDLPPLRHDEVVAWVHRAIAEVSQRQVSDAFLASLSARRLDLRSALGTWVVGRWIGTHPFARVSVNRCDICGHYDLTATDLNILSFERHKWGGVRHDHPEYIAFDLTEFAKGGTTEPTADDRALFRKILDAASSTRPDGTQGDLNKALAKILKSNEAERNMVLKILAYCGVLEDPEHPGFARVGMTAAEREQARRPAGRSDVDYPLDWWRGRHGVNESNVRLIFGGV